ncbi:MAG: preprotein translocase subunit SecE [Candidatus Aquilonibacter sp.]
MNEKKNASPAASRQQQAGGDFVRGVFTELRRVTWPTRNEWVSATILTLGLVIGVGVITWGLDSFFSWLFTLLRPHVV